jgi:hypothetical protein
VSNDISGYPAGAVQVSLGDYNGGSWHYPSTAAVAADGSYSVSGLAITGVYDLRFSVAAYDVPLFTTYFGAGLDEPLGTDTAAPGIVDSVDATDDVTLVAAGYITGAVTYLGTPVVGELVDAYDSVRPHEYDAENLTDASGNYVIKVVADTNYLVESGGDNGYEYQAYNGHNGCGCTFDAVTVGAGATQPGIDFALIKTVEFDLEQDTTDGISGGELTTGNVVLYNAVAGGFALADNESIDPSSPVDVFLDGTTPGSYRVRINDGSGHWYAIAHWIYFTLGGGVPVSDPYITDSSLDSTHDGCFVPIDGTELGDQVAVFVEIDTSVHAPACGDEPTPPAPVVPSTPRSHHHATTPIPSGLVTLPIPTPTATPTPTETPSASPSPSASATTTPAPVPTSSNGPMPWLIWLLIIIAVILIIAALAFVLLRRR